MSEVEGESELSIYPNPAQDFINITGLETGGFKLTIFDMLGNEVLFTEEIVNEKLQISSLSPGAYILRCENNKSVRNQQIIIR